MIGIKFFFKTVELNSCLLVFLIQEDGEILHCFNPIDGSQILRVRDSTGIKR